MANKPMPITSITMTMEDLNLIVSGRGSPIGLGDVLKVVKQALDEKKPIIVEDKSTRRKYLLTDDSELVEIKN